MMMTTIMIMLWMTIMMMMWMMTMEIILSQKAEVKLQMIIINLTSRLKFVFFIELLVFSLLYPI